MGPCRTASTKPKGTTHDASDPNRSSRPGARRAPDLLGCVIDTSGSGPAGTSYAFGHLDGILAGTPKKVIEASEAVLREQETHVVSSDATALDGKVVARTALDTQIEITVKRNDDSSSRISIRVGSFGDPQLSRDLYGKIKAKL